MYARVSTYRGDADGLLEGFRRTVEPLSQMEASSAPICSPTPQQGRR
jgi:hypothetical protein